MRGNISAQVEPTALAAASTGQALGAGQAVALPAARTRTGLSWVDRLTLLAIGLVVVLVTMPVLRGFGLRENEKDAVRVLRVLASHPAAPGTATRTLGLAAAVRDPALRQRLENLEALPDGRLRRHGYLFDLSWTARGEPVVRAWPWEHGQTGRSAFVWTPATGILGAPNDDARFSGPDAPPQWTDVLRGGWRTVPRR